MAALKDGETCKCGEVAGAERDLSACNRLCVGDAVSRCGGGGADHSVYDTQSITLPGYLQDPTGKREIPFSLFVLFQFSSMLRFTEKFAKAFHASLYFCVKHSKGLFIPRKRFHSSLVSMGDANAHTLCRRALKLNQKES